MHTSGKGCCDVAYQSQLQAWTNWQQWAVYQTKVQSGNHIMMPVLCSDTTQPFIALFSFRDKPEPCELFPFQTEWRELLTNSEHHKPQSYLFTVLVLFKLCLKCSTVVLYFYCDAITVSATICRFHGGVKQPWKILEKTETFAYTCIWEIQGLQLREESEWRQEQPVLGRGCISGLGVTACPSSSTCTSSSKKR